jgi:apolipoprotein N-acyltransferase
LTSGGIVRLAVLAVAAFHLGFLYAPLSWLVLVWLGCLFALRRTSCGRWAFYTGLAVGLGIYGPQLYFFWDIFGPAAVALWLVLAFWLGLFVLLLHGVDRYWGSAAAVALAPVLWLGTEFFRSELYYLRFSWFTAGSLLPVSVSGLFLLPVFGVYGSGAWLVFLAGVIVRLVEDPRGCWQGAGRSLTAVAVFSLVLGLLFSVIAPASRRAHRDSLVILPVAGVQLEFPKVAEVIDALNAVHAAEPDEARARPALYLLSEYTFDGPVPDEVRAWCRDQQRWLVAGGKVPLDGGRFYNTAFVVGTNGEVVFEQAKSVPIQFFNDGVPAPEQRVWDAPWGKIGICICYDLSFTRVVDRLVRQGARALIVPAMDTIAWGAHQHRLNARMTPIRAAEYRAPVFRVASSGISQLVEASGHVAALLPYPGQGERISGRLGWPGRPRTSVPFDRYLAPLAVLATGLIALALGWQQHCTRRKPTADP